MKFIIAMILVFGSITCGLLAQGGQPILYGPMETTTLCAMLFVSGIALFADALKDGFSDAT